MPGYVIDLSSRAALQPALAGGKGAGLAWLHRQRARAPAGFVVTTRAFRDFLAEAAPGPDAAGAEALHSAVEAAAFPPRIAQAILRAYARLGGAVAVRSSLVGEDAGGSSYAGQFSTILQVQGEEALLAAIRACWASLFSGAAAAYMTRQPAAAAAAGAETQAGAAMAVVVQRMVAAAAGGVAFSADPISGERCVIIEAARGLGDAVVRGTVGADRYVVDARGALAETAPAAAGAPVLQEAEILRLAEIVLDLDSRAGGPRDVEWAYDGDFHILQCRPITSLAGRHVYSNRLTGDMAPGLVKPLVYSTNTHAIAREVFGRLFTELIGPNDYDFTQLVPLIRSRVYADMTLMAELLGRVGLPPNFMEMMLRSERADRGRTMRMDPKMLAAMARMVRMALRHGRLPPQQAAFVARRQAELAPYRGRDWSRAAPADALAPLAELIALRNSAYWLFFVSMMGMAVRNALLRRWIERRSGGVPFNDLIRGLAGLRSLEPMQEIARLAGLVRRLPPDARGELATAGLDRLQALLGALPAGQALLAGMDAFLARFGFLSSNGSDFSASTWAENPVLVWRAVARAADCPDVASPEATAAAREEARRSIRARLGPVARLLFDRMLASVTAAIGLRESVGLMMSEYSYEIRRLVLAVADGLVAQGGLAARDDLFYLAYDEMAALVGGRLPAREAQARIAARRAEIEADARITPPSVLCGDIEAVRRIVTPEPEAGAYLSGIAGSSGTAQGRARVVNDPAEAPAVLCREDILIVPFSDVGWTPLFSSIGGIVAETGGQLSHAAIVAREYGLPAVVGVKGATRLIREGQPLAVDGNRGRVYLSPGQDFDGGASWTL